MNEIAAAERKSGYPPPKRVFIMPGFGETGKGTLKHFSRALEGGSRDGRVHPLEHPPLMRRETLEAELEKAKVFARAWYREHRRDVAPERLEAILASIPPTIFEKALAVIAELERSATPDEPLVLVGHSQGAMVQAVVATLRPDLTPNWDEDRSALIVMNPAGLTGREGFSSRALRASGKVKEANKQLLADSIGVPYRIGEIMVRNTVSTFRAFIRNINNPAMRSALNGWDKHIFKNFIGTRIEDEAHDMANTDILPFLELVAGNGVRVAVVYDEDDALFPADVIGRRLNKHPAIELHPTTGGGHFHPVTKPDEAAKIVRSISAPR